MCGYTSTLPYAFLAWCLLKDRDNVETAKCYAWNELKALTCLHITVHITVLEDTNIDLNNRYRGSTICVYTLVTES